MIRLLFDRFGHGFKIIDLLLKRTDFSFEFANDSVMIQKSEEQYPDEKFENIVKRFCRSRDAFREMVSTGCGERIDIFVGSSGLNYGLLLNDTCFLRAF